MNERKSFQKSNSNTSINENETSNFFQQYSKKKFNRIYSKNIKSLKSKNGITLIALVISIIVMLILAGVSLNATIGDNGIITQAQNATYMQSIAALEEYFNNYYVEHYEEMSKKDESKVLTLTTLEPNWFYIPANEGIGGLRYIVDSEGHALYLIKKSGLPEEIKNQIKGGEAGEGTYTDYAGLNDVYGLTSDLKVYYCSNGTDSIMGKTVEDLDADSPRRPVFKVAENSDIYNLLKDFDNTDGESDGVLTAEEVKSVTKLTINSTSNITDFSSFYNLVSLRELTIDSKTLNNLAGIENCPQLNYVYFKSSVIADYSSLSKVNKLKYLYLYNIDDNELTKLCDGIKDAQLSNLEYLAVVGNSNNMSSTNVTTSYNSTKTPKTITNLEPLTSLSSTTKSAVKYLSIHCNNITGDLTKIKDFTNLILLRCEYNNLTSLAGMENMNNIVYLCGVGNRLGTINSNGTETKESTETGTSISSLANKEFLYQVNLMSNSNLANVSYFKNDTALKYLYLSGCSTTMNVNVIKDQIIACGSNYSLPVKFLTGTVYNVANYYTPANVTYEELYSDLYGNTTITHLNLEGCTKINNTQFNTILSSMKQLKYLTLKDNTTLTSIDFINNNKVTGLIELDLRNTGVKGENSLVNLNEYATELRTLRVSDGSDFKNITTTINRLTTGGTKNYWYGDSAGSMSGLVCSSIDIFKNLEGLISLKQLKVGQWESSVGSKDEIIDLRNTGLTSAHIQGVVANFYFPSSITSFVVADSGVPIIAENSNNLTDASVVMPWYDMSKKKDFFYSLKNAPNLTRLDLSRMCNLGITSLSDYFKSSDGKEYELSSVINLNLSGYSDSVPQNNFRDLKGIDCFKNLQTFTLNYTSKILDISEIKKCTDLKNVSLAYCNIQTINGLEFLNNLTTLKLNNNNISNLKPLENLTNLTSLNLENNTISDTVTYTDTDGSVKTINNINLLANLNKSKNGKLEKLYLSGNDNIINWSPLSSLTWSAKSGW